MEKSSIFETNFKEVTIVHVVPGKYRRSVMRSHLSIWVHATGVTSDFIVKNMYIEGQTIGFYNKSDAENFMVWWKKYEQLFLNDISNSYYPNIPEGEATVFACKIDDEEDRCDDQIGDDDIMNEYKIRNNLHRDWLWIVMNTEGAYYAHNFGWLFKNNTDYTLFKMLQK